MAKISLFSKATKYIIHIGKYTCGDPKKIRLGESSEDSFYSATSTWQTQCQLVQLNLQVFLSSNDNSES
jgi:hypothetical protein